MSDLDKLDRKVLLERLAEYEVLTEKFLLAYADDIIEGYWWEEYFATHHGPITPEEIAAKKQENDDLRRRVNATVICGDCRMPHDTVCEINKKLAVSQEEYKKLEEEILGCGSGYHQK